MSLFIFYELNKSTNKLRIINLVFTTYSPKMFFIEKITFSFSPGPHEKIWFFFSGVGHPTRIGILHLVSEDRAPELLFSRLVHKMT